MTSSPVLRFTTIPTALPFAQNPIKNFQEIWSNWSSIFSVCWREIKAVEWLWKQWVLVFHEKLLDGECCMCRNVHNEESSHVLTKILLMSFVLLPVNMAKWLDEILGSLFPYLYDKTDNAPNHDSITTD
jgi:hypothetical protein